MVHKKQQQISEGKWKSQGKSEGKCWVQNPTQLHFRIITICMHKQPELVHTINFT